MYKVIELEIDPEISGDTGVFEVAWVEYPAIEQELMYFGKENFYRATDEVASVACRAIKENEKRGNPAATQVGKIRGQQLCNKDEISLETIKRMKSYLERAKVYNSGDWDDKGTISWHLWGGQSGLDWVDRILKQEERKEEEFVYPSASESKDEFIARCIPYLIEEGKTPEQSAGQCYGMWENRKFAEVGPRGGIRESKKAPKSDTPNKDPQGVGTGKGKATDTRSAEVSERVEKILKNKSDDFNERYKDKLGYGVNVGMLKSVYQRGAGAYNVSHSPRVRSAEQWSLARVNAFLFLVRTGRSENPKYTSDYDLLPSGHPKKDKFAATKVSFDWDETLSTRNGKKLLEQELSRGSIIYIISARSLTSPEMIDLANEYGFPATHIFTVGSNKAKVEKIKELGIKRHYDNNFQVIDQLGPVGIKFDYDITGLPVYDNYPPSGETNSMLVEPLLSDCGCYNEDLILDVFGYRTKNFEVCPGAIETFKHLLEMNPDDDTIGMIRSAAQIADNIFGIEKDVISKEEASEQEVKEATILIDDFKDLMGEIDEILGMEHPVEYMDGHLEKIKEYYDERESEQEFHLEEYSIEELEAYEILMEFKKTNFEEFKEFVYKIDGRTEDQVKALNLKNPTVFFQYQRKVTPKSTLDRPECMAIEDKFFRRLEIDMLRNTALQYGHNGQPYSKWLWKFGPNCIHAWRKFLVQESNFADQGWAEGQAGKAMLYETKNNGYFSPRTRRQSEGMSSVSYMKNIECAFGDLCKIDFTKEKEQMFAAKEEERMIYTPLMIPNILIPRLDEASQEKYYVKFKPEVIKNIRDKFMAELRNRKTNYEHSNKKFEDVVMVETWIVQGEKDKAYELGFTQEQIPFGTWMGAYKVLDTKEGNFVWNEYIKPGKVRGASVEGNFILNFSALKGDEYLLEQVINILKQITD